MESEPAKEEEEDEGCARSTDRGDSEGRFISNSPVICDDIEEKKALDFNDLDPAFRIFICNYPVAPVFLIISMVKLFLLLAALMTTIAQLILHSASSISHEEVSNYISTTSRTPKIKNEMMKGASSGRSSWASAIFYFEPSWWLALAYLRLVVALVAISSVLCGLLGMWRQKRSLLFATAVVDCGLVLFLVGYLALLASHAVKYDDYFAFCIGGLALLALLLISVMCLHAAVVTRRYLRSMLAFLAAAKNRWPDAYDEAVDNVRRRNSERGRSLGMYGCLPERYAIASELARITTAELIVLNRHEPLLHDIEEEEDAENGEEYKAV